LSISTHKVHKQRFNRTRAWHLYLAFAAIVISMALAALALIPMTDSDAINASASIIAVAGEAAP